MRHRAQLDRHGTVLLLIDLQEAYRPVLHAWDRVVAASTLLVRGVGLLGIPLLVTEQYPQGLGHTARELVAHLPRDLSVVEKLSISCCGNASFVRQLEALGRYQVLVAGIETHACVNQTVHDLIAAGYQVHVACDATSSRRASDVTPAWEKMRAAGALPTSSEQALLELVATAESGDFKTLQRLLRETHLPGDRA